MGAPMAGHLAAQGHHLCVYNRSPDKAKMWQAQYGGEIAISVYGIINRVMMFALSPVLGVSQGFLPVAGFNIGAQKKERVKETIKTAIAFGTVLGTIIFVGILIFKEEIIRIFTTDTTLIADTPHALLVVFLVTPIVTMQLIGSAYFQAAGKAMPALILTLLKQGIFLIPLAYFLPKYFELMAEHSICQPGKPSPHGLCQRMICSGGAFFHNAKSDLFCFSSWLSNSLVVSS